MKADLRSPDRSACRNCGEPISWDEICYVHDKNGFANCGLTVSGGRSVGAALINPILTVDPAAGGKNAEPVEWNRG